ncbi:MAG: hypothetical protein FWD73_16355 [Polyangiaceae bacterium]|nr:hypothetical protein [Polyangiaceae bacterium]
MICFVLHASAILAAGTAGLAFTLARPSAAQSPAPAASPTPSGGDGVTTIFVSGGSRSLFKIAVVPPQGEKTASSTVTETASRDFTLSNLFQVLDANSFTANLAKEGTSIDPSSWRNVGAEAVVKGVSSMRGSTVHLELRLFVVSRGSDAVLKREYDVAPSDVRSAVHQFGNEVVKYFTGTPASFGSRLVFSATTGPGQKGIFAIDSDGRGAGRLPSATNVALAPAPGPGGIYYAGELAGGGYELFKVGSPAAVFRHPGLVFGAAFGGGKMAVVIAQAGQSDIWVGSPDGANLSKVTRGGLNTHPAFGPGGQLAYVSNQDGNPQIYVDGKRISYQGTYNMAPAWCNDPEGVKILFMGREGGTWDIFSVSPSGSGIRRLTQDQGSNTYPACSPDGRSVAFFSTRGGLYMSNTQGQNQQKIANVTGESLRWE